MNSSSAENHPGDVSAAASAGVSPTGPAFTTYSASTEGFLSRPRQMLMTAETAGDVWIFALELARELGRQGIATALAAMGGRPDREQRQAASALPLVDLFESNFKLEWMPEPWEDLRRAGEWLLELERQVHPDLVHLNGYSHGALPWQAPVVVVGYSCVLSRWQAVHGTPAPNAWDRYREAVTRGLRSAKLVLAPSLAMLSELERLYGPLPATAVVRHGRRPACQGTCRKEKLILSAGRLGDEAKNISLVGAVAAELAWPVYLAGESQSPAGNRLAWPYAHLLGRLEPMELAAWMARASIFVLPAKYEPFGLSILEAAQAGCALVLGDIASLRELWEDAAVFVPPDNPDELKDALDELICHPAWLAEMSKRAVRRARQYTPDQMSADYLEAYARLLDLRRPAPLLASGQNAAALSHQVLA